MILSDPARTATIVTSRLPGARNRTLIIVLTVGVCSYAPFGTFSERKIGSNPSSQQQGSNPGPGSYNDVGYGKHIENKPKKAVSGSSFTSKVSDITTRVVRALKTIFDRPLEWSLRQQAPRCSRSPQ